MRLRRAAAQAHRTAPLGPVYAKATNGDISTGLLKSLPAGWNKPTVANNGEVRFQTESKAIAPSQATLAVVARSRPNPAYVTQREQSHMLSGVAFSDLRRIVIEKMIKAGGWVINDYERQVNGMRVFVVIAQHAHRPEALRPEEELCGQIGFANFKRDTRAPVGRQLAD